MKLERYGPLVDQFTLQYFWLTLTYFSRS